MNIKSVYNEIFIFNLSEMFKIMNMHYKLSSWCIVTASALWLFLTMQWVGMQCVIVVFPDHTHLLFLFIYTPQVHQSK